MTNTIAIRTATADDVTRIVSLLNAAFAMERAFVEHDRTSVEEITRYRETGTFFIVDAEGDSLACVASDIRIVNLRTEPPAFYRALGFVETGTEPLIDPLLTKPAHFIT